MKLTSNQNLQIRTTILSVLASQSRALTGSDLKTETGIVDSEMSRRLDNLARGRFLIKKKEGINNVFSLNPKGKTFIKDNGDKVLNIADLNVLLSKGRAVSEKSMAKKSSSKKTLAKKYVPKKTTLKKITPKKTGPMQSGKEKVDDIQKDQAQEHLRQQETETQLELIAEVPLKIIEQNTAFDNMTLNQMREAVHESHDLRRKLDQTRSELGELRKRLMTIQELSSIPSLIDVVPEKVA